MASRYDEIKSILKEHFVVSPEGILTPKSNEVTRAINELALAERDRRARPCNRCKYKSYDQDERAHFCSWSAAPTPVWLKGHRQLNEDSLPVSCEAFESRVTT